MKSALVTGGSRGIGRAICLELAAAGYYVLVNYRSGHDAAAVTLALIREQGGDGELLPFDVGDKDGVRQQLTAYSAAKAGVIGATKVLAAEVGRHGITVNAVAPGFIHTEMTAGLDEKEMKTLIPVRRFGLPKEVAFAVAFLASPRASYITAEVLSINGGLYS